jgi:hypothetical protein
MPVYLGNTEISEFLGNNEVDLRIKWPLFIDYLIVGGGGAAGQEDSAFQTGGGGGGAGQFISSSTIVYPTAGQTFSVVVGTGGTFKSNLYTQGFPGSSSVFLGLTAIGGGGGGAKNELAGGDGASGGGATYFTTTTANGGVGSAGFNGAASFYNSQPAPDGTYRSGCGGGAGGAASVGTLTSSSIAGLPKAWLDGNLYAGGGISDDTTGPDYSALSGSGGPGTAAGLLNVGRNGIVKVRYQGDTALFIGGTTEVSGGYVYHTFTSSSNFTYKNCTSYTVYNSSPSLGGQVSYIPCGKTEYRSQFVGQGETISLCVQNDQIVNVSGYASSSLTNTNTNCTASLVDCISYTVTNTAGVTRDYSGIDCSNCATSLYSINAGVSVVRCFVSGTFATDYPLDVTATAGATCNVSGSGCQIPL